VATAFEPHSQREATSLVAVIFFLVVIGIAIGVWALVAYARAGAKAADTGIDRTSRSDGPSLLEDDLSFAGRDGASENDGGATASEPVDDHATTRR
jgi:hypothetical protein